MLSLLSSHHYRLHNQYTDISSYLFSLLGLLGLLGLPSLPYTLFLLCHLRTKQRNKLKMLQMFTGAEVKSKLVKYNSLLINSVDDF